ncbi:Calcium-binding protein 1 [Bagarius yarrelli]|uniref:Calcium-binding protein 1 n=1 Tax=Bagarius yarrelli TaxID=175774 RepID=A0A556V5Q3_BAGYA|nr:Calcium-binding protein 1 [Bagarius yarrelli]
MFMLIRDGAGGGGSGGGMSTVPERTPKQVQAAIKKTVEKQKKQLESGETFGNTLKSNGGQRHSLSALHERTGDGDDEEVGEAVAGTEEQRGKEETDLTPMVDSMFGQFDSNGDGQISISELREAMKKLMGEQLNPRDIDDIIRDVDLNGDGQVDFEVCADDVTLMGRMDCFIELE